MRHLDWADDWEDLDPAERLRRLESDLGALQAKATRDDSILESDPGRAYRLAFWRRTCPAPLRSASLAGAHEALAEAVVRIERWLDYDVAAKGARPPLFVVGKAPGKSYLACAAATVLAERGAEMRFMSEDDYLPPGGLAAGPPLPRPALSPRQGLVFDGLGATRVSRELNDFQRAKVIALLTAAGRAGAPLIVTSNRSAVQTSDLGETVWDYLAPPSIVGRPEAAELAERLGAVVISMQPAAKGPAS